MAPLRSLSHLRLRQRGRSIARSRRGGPPDGGGPERIHQEYQEGRCRLHSWSQPLRRSRCPLA
eukprot:5202189-Pyramimonas_sp.AAC.1